MEQGKVISITRKAPQSAIDVRIERQIIIGMIVSKEFNQGVKSLWNPAALRLPYGKAVGEWCMEYFDTYKMPPGRQIEAIFADRGQALQVEEREIVQTFLASISEEYARTETWNWAYELDHAEKYFRISAIAKLEEALRESRLQGNPEEGEQLVAQYVRPARPTSKGGNPIKDLAIALESLRAVEKDVLFRLPGALGEMLGPVCRGELTALVGPSTVGKTWWLIYFAVIAMMKGLNVIFFSYEMPRAQIDRRIWQMITGCARKTAKVLIPIWDCILNQYGICPARMAGSPRLMNKENKKPSFEYVPQGYKACCECRDNNLGIKGARWYPDTWFKEEERKGLNDAQVIAKHRAIMATSGSRIGDLHVAAFPSGAMSVSDVRAYVKNREYYEGVATDLIITDSADKMAPEGRHDEARHGIFSIWTAHKAMAEEFHAGVVTVSHSNTERSGKQVRQGDWAEDIRKLRESDRAAATNQSPEDKLASRYSLNALKLRDDEFDVGRAVYVLACLSIGKPYLDSAWVKRISQAKLLKALEK